MEELKTKKKISQTKAKTKEILKKKEEHQKIAYDVFLILENADEN